MSNYGEMKLKEISKIKYLLNEIRFGVLLEPVYRKHFCPCCGSKLTVKFDTVNHVHFYSCPNFPGCRYGMDIPIDEIRDKHELYHRLLLEEKDYNDWYMTNVGINERKYW